MQDAEKNMYNRLKSLRYEDFKTMAKDPSLSSYEKIGFPDSYREGKEWDIFNDIIAKLDIQNGSGQYLLDIGIGCSDLSKYMVDFTKEKEIRLLAVDSKEMLEHLPEDAHVEKIAGYFPDETEVFVSAYNSKVNYIVCYSIFHYVFYNTCSFKFLDAALSLLCPGGKLLLADIPNHSKRQRFFSSEAGIKFHKAFTKTDTLPLVNYGVPEPGSIDDGVIFGIMQRYRNAGYETYLLPQAGHLPMANRREDLLIVRH
jgi:SAM-dependent methyltransferase